MGQKMTKMDKAEKDELQLARKQALIKRETAEKAAWVDARTAEKVAWVEARTAEKMKAHHRA